MALDFQRRGHSYRSLAALCFAMAILQILVAPHLSLLGGRINFMLALVLVASLGSDSRTIVYVGFFAGIFYDLTSLAPIGFMTLLLTLLSYLISMVSRGVAPGLSVESLRLVAMGALFVNLLYVFGLFFMGVEGNLLVSLGVHGLASAILTFIACIPILLFKRGSSTFGDRSYGMGARGLGGSGSRFKGLR